MSENVQSENLEEMDFEMGDEDVPQSDVRGIEDEDEAEEEDEISRLGDSSDDPEQKQRYLEYLELVKEINCQNKTIEDLKAQIMALCQKPCKTRCEMKNIQCLRQCMEQENLKLQCLMEKAIRLQNFGSRRRYHDLPIATTLDEDNMAPYVGSIQPQKNTWKPDGKGSNSDSGSPCPCPSPCPTPCPCPCPCICPCPDEGSNVKNLVQALGKIKICCPKDKQLVQEILNILRCSQKKPKKSVCREHGPQKPCHDTEPGDKPCDDTLDKIKNKICSMQAKIDHLKQEICKREAKASKRGGSKGGSQDCIEEPDPLTVCGGKGKADQMKKLTDNYVYLLSEFAKKDCQLKELEQRMKGLNGDCNKDKGKDSTDQCEIQLLRARVNEMKEEQTEFKCIMKEQSQQLEDYRNKYLGAQQKVEEQSAALEKLSMNNRRIEKQINTEIKDIRTKFQAKLNELLHFPKLLENEQLKLAQVCQEKEDLQGKLVLVCKELKATKAKADTPNEAVEARQKLIKCEIELSDAKTKMDELLRQRDLFCEKLKCTQDDLDTMRSESAKIISRTKERAASTKQQQKEQIDRLEKELAQCRASACMSVNDREAVIREMQGQLNTLSYSFDAAQKQIKTLRNHIAYVSNDNCFPIKC